MKISTLSTMLLIVGVFLFLIISMVHESETNYDIDINESAWEDQYDFANDVNDSISPLKNSIDDITSEDTGWLEKVGSGFTGIIAAVTFLPSFVWSMGKMGTNLITGLGTFLGVPSEIILVFIIMISLWGIYQLIQFFQRWKM